MSKSNSFFDRIRQWLALESGFLFILLFLLYAPALQAKTVKDFKSYSAACSVLAGGAQEIALRKFKLDSQACYLTVNPANLSTHIRNLNQLQISEIPWDTLRVRYKDTPYMKILGEAEKNSAKMKNAGITHLPAAAPGIHLTVDLCPSLKPLDSALFTSVIREFGATQKPVPMALSVSGLWIRGHARELEWIKGLEKDGSLSLLWMDHSYTHGLEDTLVPPEESYMLKPGIDIRSEVLRTEMKLIEKDLVPSIFFRFPALISNAKIFRKVTALGLVPMGSDAWLARRQKPADGSIVLVHGNGNDPFGLERFSKLVETHRGDIQSGRWKLLDLREGAVSSR